MALVDLVEWRPTDRDILAWHFPQNNLSTYTQLLVAESQEAVLIKEGRIIGKLGPGRHTLDTKNLPLLNKLYGIPFGGKNPFTAEIWYINKLLPLNIDYKTSSFKYHDPDYKSLVELFSTGRYGLQVTDSERFLKKFVGTAEEIRQADVTDQFQGEIDVKLKSSISQKMQAATIGLKAVSGYLEQLSIELKGELAQFWSDYGMTLTAFYVTSIDLDETTETGQKIAKAMAQQAAQNIAGYTWQQGQAFEVAKDALGGNSEMGILGAMMMAGGGGLFGGGGNGGGAMTPVQSAAGAEEKSHGQFSNAGGADAGTQMVFCSKCAKKYPASSKFCPHCGDRYNPCPKCGTDNSEAAERCVNCGAVLKAPSVGTCAKCGAPLDAGAAFCPNCGASTAASCPRCHAAVKPGSKFCPSCGKKL